MLQTVNSSDIDVINSETHQMKRFYLVIDLLSSMNQLKPLKINFEQLEQFWVLIQFVVVSFYAYISDRYVETLILKIYILKHRTDIFA